jgi:hypothetical protein
VETRTYAFYQATCGVAFEILVSLRTVRNYGGSLQMYKTLEFLRVSRI